MVAAVALLACWRFCQMLKAGFGGGAVAKTLWLRWCPSRSACMSSTSLELASVLDAARNAAMLLALAEPAKWCARTGLPLPPTIPIERGGDGRS